MRQANGRRNTWQVVGVLLVAVAMTTSFRLADDAPEVVQVERVQSRPEQCRELSVPVENLTWDDELEVYLPINHEWESCMGVSRR